MRTKMGSKNGPPQLLTRRLKMTKGCHCLASFCDRKAGARSCFCSADVNGDGELSNLGQKNGSSTM